MPLHCWRRRLPMRSPARRTAHWRRPRLSTTLTSRIVRYCQTAPVIVALLPRQQIALPRPPPASLVPSVQNYPPPPTASHSHATYARNHFNPAIGSAFIIGFILASDHMYALCAATAQRRRATWGFICKESTTSAGRIDSDNVGKYSRGCSIQ